MLPNLPESGRRDAGTCAAALRGGSRSFHAASRLLPERPRVAATALYAFCRDADDAIDHAAPGDRDAVMDALHARLDAIYAGTPAPIAADRAFARIVAEYDIPRALPAALLEGFAWDAEGRQYETIEDLEHYAARVAGTVGTMMAIIMGVRRADTLAHAAALGLAMQLTNIARDVGEDARAGRCYLPLDWMRQHGIDPAAFLLAPAGSQTLQGVVARVLAHADTLYRRAAIGVADLPVGCRPAIHAARLLYAAIGHAAARPGFDSVATRAVVPARQKAVLVATAIGCALGDGLRPRSSAKLASMPSVAMLVAAAARYDAPARRPPIWRRAEDRAIWVLDLFAELEARQREARSPLRTGA